MRKESKEKRKEEEKFSVFVSAKDKQEAESLHVMKLSLDNLDKVSPQDDAFRRWGK